MYGPSRLHHIITQIIQFVISTFTPIFRNFLHSPPPPDIRLVDYIVVETMHTSVVRGVSELLGLVQPTGPVSDEVHLINSINELGQASRRGVV